MKHEDRRKYFHWDKRSLLDEVLKLHKKLVKIDSISSLLDCSECPKTRPKNHGCGLNVCLDQIADIINSNMENL